MKQISAIILSLLFYAFMPAVAAEWALPALSIVNMRSEPRHSAELASQALMGMPVRIIERQGDWCLIETPDSYRAWAEADALSVRSDSRMNDWRESDRLVVTAVYTVRCYSKPGSRQVSDVVSDLVNGDIVEQADAETVDGCHSILLPDGRKAWVDSDVVTPIRRWAMQDFNSRLILDMASSMMGQPYLWGGTSTKGVDCSGLVKVCYLANGIILPRDAAPQGRVGKHISADCLDDCKSGDLLFFGNGRTGRITHVAIYDRDKRYIHSSGRVRRNSFDPNDSIYLGRPVLHAVRIDGHIGTQGIVRAADHPWYFNL